MTSQTTVPVGICWNPGVWDLAGSAYVADLDTDADSPGSFADWLAHAREIHARRSPQRRAEMLTPALMRLLLGRRPVLAQGVASIPVSTDLASEIGFDG